VEFIRSILKEIGLGEERLLLSYLPGSAQQDLALASSEAAVADHTDSLGSRIASIRDSVVEACRILPPNPLRQSLPGTPDGNGLQRTSSFEEEGEDE
jgi:hypothetical protein